jgi:hypothetical protein
MESLIWQGSELVPLAYGVKKLRIICQVEDDKIMTDDLEEAIQAIEGVQSTDIFAFNKVRMPPFARLSFFFFLFAIKLFFVCDKW